MTKDDVKWIEVDNPEEWYCDMCQKCTDPTCCDRPVEWLKHPNTKTEPHFRGVGDWNEGRLEDIALCNRCFDDYRDFVVEKWAEQL